MKTASLTYPSLHLIDTAPLFARYAVLTKAILTMVIVGQPRESGRLTHKVVRLIQALTRCEAHNSHLKRKLDMLVNMPWREQVLKELGGMRKLKLWEAAKARIETRAAARPKAVKDERPAWLLTPERMAESERLKARARMCGRATAHPLIVRDRVKMDFDGLFRLAPLPRGERAKRQVKIYTQNSIVEYDWNNIPFAKEEGFGPASVWPVEFYAAMAAERNNADRCHTDANRCLRPQTSIGPVPMPETVTKERRPILAKHHGMGSGLCLASQTQGRNDTIETTPLRDALSEATYRYIFENPV